MSILDVLGCRHGTEKASNAAHCLHNYLPFYEQFLAPLRDKEITLLEIGVDRGNSLRMWRDYFQRGRIIGMDIYDKHEIAGDRIETVVGSQIVEADLHRVATEFGPFDVIVDDACHDPSAQVYCYKAMIGHVKPGGFYILEDLVGLRGEVSSPECLIFLTQTALDIIQHRVRIESIAFSYGTSVTRIRS